MAHVLQLQPSGKLCLSSSRNFVAIRRVLQAASAAKLAPGQVECSRAFTVVAHMASSVQVETNWAARSTLSRVVRVGFLCRWQLETCTIVLLVTMATSRR